MGSSWVVVWSDNEYGAIIRLLFRNNRPSKCTKEYKNTQNQTDTSHKNMADKKVDVATLGGGCFWCIEAIFKPLKGIEKLVSGYAGGNVPNPSYKAVCTGSTGHAEVVQITFDPAVISFEEILEIFFAMHDPTTLNRQGGDRGTQYRSTIMYHNDEQRVQAEGVIARFTEEKVFDDPIVTEVVPLDIFYPAEDYHQDYFANNTYQPYCMAVIAPKVIKLRKKYAERLVA